jgi:hypothetical protein
MDTGGKHENCSIGIGGTCPLRPGRPTCDPQDGRGAYRFVWYGRPLQRVLQRPVAMTRVAQLRSVLNGRALAAAAAVAASA